MSDQARSPAFASAGGDGSDIPASAAYRIELPEFEGPLDLLLHLCKTHELDILQIPIAFVTEKYLAYLETMQAMSVEIAAEYLVMAATLAYLKARELVPNPEPLEGQGEEEGEAVDPREELIRRLLEYQKYKDAAAQLGGRPIEGRNVFGRGAKLEGPIGPGELGEHSVWKLIESFADILKKAGPKVSHEVAVDRVSLSERINQIVDRLEQGGSFRFDALVDLNASEVDVKHQLVVTLLAILELAKLRVIRVLKDEASEMFYIAHREGASLDAARRAQSTSEVDPTQDSASDSETDSEMEVASMASKEPLVDDSPTEEVRIDEMTGGPTEELPLDEGPTEEVPLLPLVPHEGLGVETVRIDPLPVEKVTPALGTQVVPDEDSDQEGDEAGSDEENEFDKR
jgi:segregation and condensation protein A